MFWSQRLTDLCELPELASDDTGTISDRPTCHPSFSDSLIGTIVYPTLDAERIRSIGSLSLEGVVDFFMNAGDGTRARGLLRHLNYSHQQRGSMQRSTTGQKG